MEHFFQKKNIAFLLFLLLLLSKAGSACTVTITNTDSTFCAGDTIIINITFSFNSGDQFPDTFFIDSAGTVIHNFDSLDASPYRDTLFIPTQPGTFLLRVIGPNCRDSIIITINPLPNVSLQIPTSAMCTDDAQINLSINGTPFGGTFSGPGISGTMFNPVTADTGINVITYQFTEITTLCSNSANDTITVSPIPAIVVTSNQSSICAGDLVTLHASGAQNYIWTLPAASTLDSVQIVASGTAINYSVTGTDINSCSAVATDSIVVNPVPNVVAVVSPDTVCEGGNLSLHADTTFSNGFPPHIFSWSGPQGFLTNNPDSILFPVAQIDSGFYTILIADSNECVDSDSVFVNVNPRPDIQLASDSFHVCVGDTISLAASGADTYLWEDGQTANFDTAFAVIGFHTLTVIGYTTFGCSDTDSVFILVDATPTVFSTGLPNTICSGDSTIIQLNTSGADAILWTRDNLFIIGMDSGGTISDSSLLIHLINPATPVSVTFTFTPFLGTCAGAPFADTIIVNPVPVLTVSSSADSLCSGNDSISISLTATGNPIFNWTWNSLQSYTTSNIDTSGTSSLIEGVFSLPAAIGLADTVYFSIICTDSATGCSTVDTVVNFVFPLPHVVLTVSDDEVCSGELIDSLIFSTSNNVDSVTYNWSWSADTAIINSTLPHAGTGDVDSIIFFNSQDGGSLPVLFSAYATANSCIGEIETLSIEVNGGTPSPGVILSDTNYLTGQMTDTLCMVPTNFGMWIDQDYVDSNPGLQYNWSINPPVPFIYNMDSTHIILQPDSVGLYSVTLNINTECTATLQRSFYVSSGATNDTAEVVLHQIANTLVYLDNQATNYQWGYDEDTTWLSHTLPGETFQDYVAASSFNPAEKYYWVTAWYGDSCFYKVYYNYPTGKWMKEEVLPENILVIPNPATDKVRFELNRKSSGTISIEIFSEIGASVMKMTDQVNGFFVEMNIRELASGIYIARLWDDEGFYQPARIIKLSERK